MKFVLLVPLPEYDIASEVQQNNNTEENLGDDIEEKFKILAIVSEV